MDDKITSVKGISHIYHKTVLLNSQTQAISNLDPESWKESDNYQISRLFGINRVGVTLFS